MEAAAEGGAAADRKNLSEKLGILKQRDETVMKLTSIVEHERSDVDDGGRL